MASESNPLQNEVPQVEFLDWSPEIECEASGCLGRCLALWDAASNSWRPVQVDGKDATACLVHAGDQFRDEYYRGLGPGCCIDLRHTTISTGHLITIQRSVNGAFGPADFSWATFEDWASFIEVTFEAGASFSWTTFEAQAHFHKTTFKAEAYFIEATFKAGAFFSEATFETEAYFGEATFKAQAYFHKTAFEAEAYFHKTVFEAEASFIGATFQRGAYFRNTAFKAKASFSEATFKTKVSFSEATFEAGASFIGAMFQGGASFHKTVFEAEAFFSGATFKAKSSFHKTAFKAEASFSEVTFQGGADFSWTKFQAEADFGGVEFRNGKILLKGFLAPAGWDVTAYSASIDAEEAVFAHGATLRLHGGSIDLRDTRRDIQTPLRVLGHPTPDLPLAVVKSLEGIDGERLVLADLDLSRTKFTGAVNLDRVRFEGGTTFGEPPGYSRSWRTALHIWGRRKVIHEETLWRRTRWAEWHQVDSDPSEGSRESSGAPGQPATPGQLVDVYRQLRKALEDEKDEPGAADFYYGEMEMRRHDNQRSWAERRLVWLYWLFSGYGLRATRSLSWLLAVAAIAWLALVFFGIPDQESGTSSAGYITTTGATAPQKAGLNPPDSCLNTNECQTITIFSEKIDPTTPKNALAERWTSDRREKALEAVSVLSVFNGDENELTGWGKVIAFFSRLLSALFLGLAFLAIRNRVKR